MADLALALNLKSVAYFLRTPVLPEQRDHPFLKLALDLPRPPTALKPLPSLDLGSIRPIHPASIAS
jgi:hypothetical protein